VRTTDRKKSPLVDTHCHIDLYPDPETVVQRVESAGIYTIAVTNTPSVFPQTAALAAGRRFIRPALGLHPELATERERELPTMWRLMDQTRYIGEVGLDYVTPSRTERARQRKIFEAIVAKCDESSDKILTVHSRRAADDTVEVFGDSFRGTVIMHWYSGPKRALEMAVDKGFYFSINTAMVDSDRSLELIKHMPRERILTETDGPFVHTSRGPAHPENTREVIRVLAKQWDLTEQNTRKTLYDNFACLLTTSSEDNLPRGPVNRVSRHSFARRQTPRRRGT